MPPKAKAKEKVKEKSEPQSSRPKEKYQKLTDREQILHRPDMYMGSIRNSDTSLYIYDEQQNQMICQDVNFNSGLLKIFDEVITNAQDQAIRTRKDRKKTKNIYVQINKQTGVITVCNDGPSIDIKKHSEYKIYIPELIFGNLRTSENYDDSQADRRVGGLNGLGVKLTNIYSKYLEIDIIYKGKRYQQRFENNMSVTNAPQISTEKTKDPDYVRVTFLPDYQKFGLNSLSDDMNKIMQKRVYDCAGSCSKLISTYLNDRQINIKSFKDYCSLYLSEDTYQLQIEQPKEIPDIKIKNKNYQQSQELRDDTQIVVAQSDGNFKQVSFINNVNTIKGGKHVDYIVDQLQKEIIAALKKKRGNKDLKFSSSFVKENLCVFLNMHVYQPTFSSQAKDEFSSDITTWGYVPIIEEKYIKKIVDSPIGQAIMDRVSLANDKPVAKNEGKKKKTLGFIDGLVDATKAGTSESNKCVLFLVEGKSAAQLVISGRSQIPNGIDYYGVFALRGKVLNVKDASQKKILANNEITQIKQILGLQQGKVYKDTSELRYGKILIATDADSVSGDTPILLRKNGQVEIQSIERIGKEFKSEDIFGKEYGNPDGYECWSDEGWTEIKHVMRHRTTKRMFRVLTHTGVVDATEDHSLLDINKNKVTPGQLKVGDRLLHSFPEFQRENKKTQKKITELDQLTNMQLQKVIKNNNIQIGCVNRNKDLYIRKIRENQNLDVSELIDSFNNLNIENDCIKQEELSNDQLQKMTVYQLYDYSKQLGMNLKPNLRKQDLINLIYNYKQPIQLDTINTSQFDIDEGWVMGFFWADGNCSAQKTVNTQKRYETGISYSFTRLRYEWRIKNQDLSLLEKAQKILQDLYNFEFTIQELKVKTGKKQNTNYELKLLGGQKVKDFVEKYQKLFYYFNSDSKYRKGNKYIPPVILNETLEFKKSFLDGYYSGDGASHSLSENKIHKQFVVESKISAAGICCLFQSVGYKVSINIYEDRPNIYFISIHQKKYDFRDPCKIKKIFDLGITDQYVYDLETANHRFQAGISSLIVSNTDGFHISALCSNLFQTIWPSLLKFEQTTFINRFLTPIIIATKKTGKQEQIDFYTQQDFDIWFEQNESQISRWKVKYFKGLAVFDQNTGKRHFKNMKLMEYHWQPQDDQYFTLAFDKKNATQRKSWLQNYDKNAILDYNESETTYTELINKELIHFSIDDVARSICSLMDGLKPSQRKILYACFKRKLWSDELRVAQLAGYCSEVSSYSHGEASLQGAIVSMAQDFVGTNNINLLLPNGQFGTRYDPKASGAPRYIHTQLNSIVKILINQDDNAILNYLKDDENMSIEPEYYLPIIPMALVNGCIGIGTGFSTKIPNYNPLDIIHNLQILLQQKKTRKSVRKNKLLDLLPYYKGFTGKIQLLDSQQAVPDDDDDEDLEEDEDEDTAQSKKKENNSQESQSSVIDKNKKYVSIGVFRRIGKTSKIEVTEIPIGKTIKSFVEHVKTTYKQPQSEVIEDIRDDGFTLTIDFQDSTIVDKLLEKESNKDQLTIYKNLQLIQSINITNMYMFNDHGQITKYHSPMEVINAFFEPRLVYYQKRKDYILQQLEKDIFVLKQKAKFIMDIINGDLDLRNKRQSAIVQELLKKGYLPLDKNNLPLKNVNNQSESIYFDFLTEMPISSYTLEKKEQLLKNLKEKEDKLEYIKNKHIADMWYEELEQLKQELSSKK